MRQEMDKKKKSRLADMQMPEKKHMGLEEGSPEEEAMESPEEEAQEEDSGQDEMESPEMEKHEDAEMHHPDLLEKASDDELLAEVKKRGLMSQLEEGSPSDAGPESEHQGMY